MFAERAGEAELVEGWWSELVDELADVGDRFLGVVAQLAQQDVCSLRVAGDAFAGEPVLEHEGRECRPEAVVEVAAEAEAFFLARDDETLSGAL